MNNLSSYCGLVDAKIRASDKYLPVSRVMVFSPFFSQEDRFVIGLHAKRVAQKQFTHVGR